MSNDDVRMSDPNSTPPEPVPLGGTPVGDAPATAGTQQDELRRYPVCREDDLTWKQVECWQRRIDACHRRYLSATKTLATVQRLAIPVIVGELNTAGQQVNVLGRQLMKQE